MISSKTSLIIFSHCSIYGGSERLMKSIYLGEKFINEYNIIFSYLYYPFYKKSLFNDLPINIDKSKFIGLVLFSNARLYHGINSIITNRFLRKITKIPFFLLSLSGIYVIWNSISFILFIYKHKPRIVHINNGGFPASEVCNQLAIVIKLFFPRIKVVYQVNSSPVKSSIALIKLMNKSVDYFVTHSNSNRLKLVEIGIIDKKICSFPSYFNDQFKEDLQLMKATKFNIVSVGFLEKRKGHYYLIGAINKLKEYNSLLFDNIQLHIIGSGNQYDILSKLIIDSNLQDKVTLWGSRSDYLYFINFADVFVLPSLYDEDLPLVLLSSMKCGKVIIASNIAGVGELLTNMEDSILIEPIIDNMSENLAFTLNNIFNDTGLQAKLKSNVLSTYNMRFSEDAYFNNLNSIFK